MASTTVGESKGLLFPQMPIVVEVSLPKCRNHILKSLRMRVRGRFRMAELAGHSVNYRFAHIGDVPGIEIHLDCKNRTCVLHDPLGDDDNKETFDRVRAIRKEIWHTDSKPWEDTVYENIEDNKIKTILNDLMYLVGKGSILKEGKLPESKEDLARMPGRREINQFDRSPRAPKLEGDPDLRGQMGISAALEHLAGQSQGSGSE